MTAREVMAAYASRLNRHDFTALVDLIAPDATFWFSEGSYRGLPEIRAAIEATWRALNNDTYWLEAVEWLADTDTVAACTYRFNWRSELDGRAISGTGRGTTILRLRDGRWQIVHEHLSSPRT